MTNPKHLQIMKNIKRIKIRFGVVCLHKRSKFHLSLQKLLRVLMLFFLLKYNAFYKTLHFFQSKLWIKLLHGAGVHVEEDVNSFTHTHVLIYKGW